jgi:hypothetical protein
MSAYEMVNGFNAGCFDGRMYQVECVLYLLHLVMCQWVQRRLL